MGSATLCRCVPIVREFPKDRSGRAGREPRASFGSTGSRPAEFGGGTAIPGVDVGHSTFPQFPKSFPFSPHALQPLTVPLRSSAWKLLAGGSYVLSPPAPAYSDFPSFGFASPSEIT
jgi:hypothetical protein